MSFIRHCNTMFNVNALLILVFLIVLSHGVKTYRTYNQYPASVQRILKGDFAKQYQIPWQVYISAYDEKSGKPFNCGGSLIAPDWVLTAAHCIKGYKRWSMYFGSIYGQEGILRKSTNATYHRKYEYLGEGATNDIGLIKLSQPLKNNANIQPIHLPCSRDKNYNFSRKKLMISGWGYNGKARKSIYLKYAYVNVISPNKCRKYYQPNNIRNSTICYIGSRGENGCYGDSGGPIAYERSPGCWVQVGVISFGSNLGCGVGPSGAMNVAHYVKWIRNKIRTTSNVYRYFDTYFV